MAKKKISELPAGSALNGTELVPIVQTGTTKRITAQDIANLGNASGVEGSGTINYLAKFTATSTIGNSLVFDNGTSVGIGTTSPSFPLDVVSNSSANALNIRTRVNDDYGFLTFSNYAGNQTISEIYIHRTGNNIGSLIFTTNNGSSSAERMRITSAGLVGIATTTPTALLQVKGESPVTPGARYLKTQIGGGNSWGLESFEELAVGFNGIRSIFSGGDNWDISFSAGTSTNWSSGTQPERMRITSAGNVGIGTTTPTGKLQINGAFGTTIDANSTALRILNTSSSAVNNKSGLTLHLNSSDWGSDFAAASIYAQSESASSGASSLVFATNTSGALAAATERMRITSGGNVLIGTTTDIASSKLTIESTTQGVLVPRMTTTQINAIGSPANGLIAYNTTLAVLCFYDGANWKKVSHSNM